MPSTHERPLLIDWVAKEDEDESKDDCPGDDNRSGCEDPDADLSRKYSPVKIELTQFQTGQSPDVYQGEGEGDLEGQLGHA